MPVSPLVVPREVFGGPHLACQHAQHEKGELRGGLSQYVRGMSERNFVAVGVGAIDVVNADGQLSHNFQTTFSSFENLGIDGIAKRGDEPIDPGLHLVDDQTLGWRLGLGIDLDFVLALAQQVNGVANIASGKNPKFLTHAVPSLNRLGKPLNELSKRFIRTSNAWIFPRSAFPTEQTPSVAALQKPALSSTECPAPFPSWRTCTCARRSGGTFGALRPRQSPPCLRR